MSIAVPKLWFDHWVRFPFTILPRVFPGRYPVSSLKVKVPDFAIFCNASVICCWNTWQILNGGRSIPRSLGLIVRWSSLHTVHRGSRGSFSSSVTSLYGLETE